jgi:hypothetical protein
MMNIDMSILPYDSGVSVGRRLLLSQVETEYFVLVDDDNEFSEQSGLQKGLGKLKEKGCDLLGGIYVNYYPLDSLYQILVAIKHPHLMKNGIIRKTETGVYTGSIDDKDDQIEIKFNPKRISNNKTDCYRTDFSNNFFIARTDVIRAFGGWKHDGLKNGEHMQFFIDAKRAGVYVCSDESFRINHYPSRNFSYSKFRFRAAELKKEVGIELGIKRYVEKSAEGKIIFSYGREDV